MRKISNPIFVLSLAGAFFFSSIVCCCTHHLTQEKTSKSGCCHKTAKADPVKCTDGCLSLTKSAETAKTFDLNPSATVHISPIIVSTIAFNSVPVIKSLHLNGPPGIIAIVPLYTQFHTLRI